MFKKCLILSCFFFCALLQMAYSQSIPNDELVLFENTLYVPINSQTMDALGLIFYIDSNGEINIRKTYGISKSLEMPLPVWEPLRLNPLYIPILVEGHSKEPNPPLIFSRGHFYLPVTTSWASDLLEIKVTPNKKIQNHFDPSIPIYYNTYDFLPQDHFIRDQGSANTCWAFAANSMFELYVAFHYDRLMTFSVEHLLENVPIPTTPYSGGYFQGASAYYLGHLGPIDEEHSEDSFVLRSYVTYTRMNDVKRHIKNNGAVLTAIFYDPDRSGFFNHNTASYFNPSSNNPKTHDILLIGWDDAYPKENFQSRPMNNGAFIAQNSFGTDWGDQGLFYISYEDVHVLNNVHGYDAIDQLQQDEFLYYHNDKGVTHFEGFPGHHNVIGLSKFTSLPIENEYLTGFGVYTNSLDIQVTLFVIQETPYNFEDTIGEILFEGTMDKIGYHYIPLQSPVPLLQNSDFYIGAKYQGNDSFLFPIQAPYPGIDFEIIGFPNRSYLGYESESLVFFDMYRLRENASIALRAYSRQK